MRQSPEILAPAGSMEALTAAVHCGADAVYIGATLFSARQNAHNFDAAALREAADFCHTNGVKLYLTVNTLVFDTEWAALDELLQTAAAVGIDACIVQDLGVADYIHQRIPEMPLHASTQMTICSPSGAIWAKEHGFSRVVVAREMTRSEIQAVCAIGLEVEQFVHGALCMCISGQCYLSAMIGARSANRGCCAQACRLPFTAAKNPQAAALSLKDLCLLPHYQQLCADGIASLKIEGRMKRPEYVAAAVTALRQLKEGKQPDLQMLRAVFSRSGFTDGYYTGKRQQMFGTRQKDDVLQGQKVLPQLAQLYQKPTPQVPLDMHVTVQTGQPAVLKLRDGDGISVSVSGDVVQPARTKATDLPQLERQLGKLGGTLYTLSGLQADCDGTGMLPASAWNALRREGIVQMNAARIAANTPKYTMRHITLPALPEAGQHTIQYRIIQKQWDSQSATLLKQPDVEALLLPADTVSDAVPAVCRERIFLTLPRFCADEAKVRLWLEQAKALGFSHVVCENVSHIRLCRSLGLTLHGGMGLNAANPSCLSFLQRESLQDVILSPELTIAQSRHCTGLPAGAYAYGFQPVMTMRNCPVQAEAGCRNCTHGLTDRTGRTFPVYCHKAAGITTMYNAVPTWLADKQEQLSHSSFLVLDCTLQPDACSVLRAYQNGEPTKEAMTRGLFFRGVE